MKKLLGNRRPSANPLSPQRLRQKPTSRRKTKKVVGDTEYPNQITTVKESWGLKAADTLGALKALVVEYKKQAQEERNQKIVKQMVETKRLEKKLEEIRLLETQKAQEEAIEKINAQAKIEEELEKNALLKAKEKALNFEAQERSKILEKRLQERQKRLLSITSLKKAVNLTKKSLESSESKTSLLELIAKDQGVTIKGEAPTQRHWTQYVAGLLGIIAIAQTVFIFGTINQKSSQNKTQVTGSLEEITPVMPSINSLPFFSESMELSPEEAKSLEENLQQGESQPLLENSQNQNSNSSPNPNPKPEETHFPPTSQIEAQNDPNAQTIDSKKRWSVEWNN